MKTIRTKNGASVQRCHKQITKITVFMPKTGAISSAQTHGFYASLDNNSLRDTEHRKFLKVETIQNETLMLNTAHIIAFEFGEVIELTNGLCYFVKVDEEIHVIDQGDYGTTQADFQI